MTLNLYIQIVIPRVTLLLGFFINKISEDRAKLLHYYVNPASTTLSAPDTDDTIVNTHTLIIVNNGRKTANNVRLGHNILPAFSIFPSCDYSVVDLPDGKKEILIPKIVKKERILVNYLYFPPNTIRHINTYIKSDEGFSNKKDIQYTPILSKPIQLVFWLILILGSATSVYLLIKLILYLIK